MQILGGGINITGGVAISSWTPLTPRDSYWNYVSMLLSGDGTNAATNNTFTDSSANNFTVTQVGTPTQGAVNPFGGSYYSNYFNGSTDYINSTASSSYVIGTGDFCLEGWAQYTGAFGSLQAFISCFRQYAPGDYGTYIGIDSTGKPYALIKNGNTGGQSVGLTGTSAITIGQWYHYALVRNGATASLFVNGTQVATSAVAGISLGHNVITLGKYSSNYSASWWTGSVSNARLSIGGTNGYSASASTITVPVDTLTSNANTVYMSAQSNRFVDTYSAADTLTIGGTPAVRAVSPFPPAQPYSSAIKGASMLFNGSNGLTVTKTGGLGAGDFTLEFWVYPTSTGGWMFNSRTGAGGDGIDIASNFSTVSTANQAFYSGTALISNVNTWYHVAVVRSGSTVTVYLNGSSVGSDTNSNNFSGTGFNIGYSAGGNSGYLTGYISNFRHVAQALYTANFTPPTAPLTAVTNTGLLLSGAAAGIYDSAQQADLVTAGTAQVSTTTFKYGTGSISIPSTTSYLTVPAATSQVLGTAFSSAATFTIEAWVYPTAVTGSTGTIIGDMQPNGPTNNWSFGVTSTGSITLYWYDGAIKTCVSSGTVANNTWTHIAVAVSAGAVKLFINGVLQSTTGTTTLTAATSPLGYLTIGQWNNQSNYTGYIDDLRVTRGIARYTATFTTPTTNLPTY